MDGIFLECLVFHNALEKIKLGWSHSPYNTEGEIMFYAASGWIFKLQTPVIKSLRYLHRAKLSRAHMSAGLRSTRNGLRLGSWACSINLPIPDLNSQKGTSNMGH